MIKNPALIRAISKIHAALYRLSGGAVGGRVSPGPVLLLTTRGHRSGRLRTTPLLFWKRNDEFVVVASNAGSAEHPGWWLNLQKHPIAAVEVQGQIVNVQARLATGIEREELWPWLVERHSNYALYQKRTNRTIPVVILSPQHEDG